MFIFSTHHLVLSKIMIFPCLYFYLSVVSSLQVSSHLVKSNSFHLQTECCPNYITLIPSLSCLTGVLCPFVQVLFALSSLASLFNRSAARIWSSLIPFLNRSVFNIYLPFNLKVSQCSLSLVSNGVFSTLFSFVLFFSRISSTSQGSLVSLVRQRSNLVLPLLSFSSVVPPVPF